MGGKDARKTLIFSTALIEELFSGLPKLRTFWRGSADRGQCQGPLKIQSSHPVAPIVLTPPSWFLNHLHVCQ